MEFRPLRGELLAARRDKGLDLGRHRTNSLTAAMPLVVRSHVIPKDWM